MEPSLNNPLWIFDLKKAVLLNRRATVNSAAHLQYVKLTVCGIAKEHIQGLEGSLMQGKCLYACVEGKKQQQKLKDARRVTGGSTLGDMQSGG